ncbi:MAG: chorismate-binding protein [Actinomycetota bacterium]|nr:chorismate-binding protein [Actinomycetota bacterium]
MGSISDTSLNGRVSQLGALSFFKKASGKRKCSFIRGLKETVVTAGEYKTYLVSPGLAALDPLQRESYSPTLTNELSREHLFTAIIPFSPSAAFTVVVPTVAVLFADDKSVNITCPDDCESEAAALILEILEADSAICQNEPLSLRVDRTESAAEFRSRVAGAIEKIASSNLKKVVLSKAMRLTGPKSLNSAMIFDRLAHDRPYTYLFSMNNYIGASPELVISRDSSVITSYPLAGTAASGDEARLLLSEKDDREHSIVVSQIITRLTELGIPTDLPPKPTITSYGEIVHLGSRISGRNNGAKPFSSIEVAAHLSPTAAINGEPYDSALKYITSFEPSDRGFYGGLVGYQKYRGDGTWILNIRSIELIDDGLMLRAGVGIVERSDPIQEDLEATSKINAIASSLLES